MFYDFDGSDISNNSENCDYLKIVVFRRLEILKNLNCQKIEIVGISELLEKGIIGKLELSEHQSCRINPIIGKSELLDTASCMPKQAYIPIEKIIRTSKQSASTS